MKINAVNHVKSTIKHRPFVMGIFFEAVVTFDITQRLLGGSFILGWCPVYYIS